MIRWKLLSPGDATLEGSSCPKTGVVATIREVLQNISARPEPPHTEGITTYSIRSPLNHLIDDGIKTSVTGQDILIDS